MPRAFFMRLEARLVLLRNQVNRCVLAAAINFDVEFQLVTFVEVRQASAFDRADVNERIRLSIVTLNKAKALHRVEELDSSSGFFAGQLALRPATAAATIIIARRAGFDRNDITDEFNISRRNTATAIDQRIFQLLSFAEARNTGLLNGTDVNKHIFSAAVLNDEAKALLTIEEFDCAGAFANNLGRHATAATRSPATKAAATTAARSAKAASTTTAAIVSAAETAPTVTAKGTTLLVAVKILVTKAVTLVASATPAACAAAISVKTHVPVKLSSNAALKPARCAADVTAHHHAGKPIPPAQHPT